MQLSQAQIEAFERDGYLFFPEVFSRPEVALLKDEARRIFEEALQKARRHRPTNERLERDILLQIENLNRLQPPTPPPSKEEPNP